VGHDDALAVQDQVAARVQPPQGLPYLLGTESGGGGQLVRIGCLPGPREVPVDGCPHVLSLISLAYVVDHGFPFQSVRGVDMAAAARLTYQDRYLDNGCPPVPRPRRPAGRRASTATGDLPTPPAGVEKLRPRPARILPDA
jgi:hypothetical protein